MSGTSLAVATIVDTDHNKSVNCMFNPTEYSLSKSNNWTAIPQKGVHLGNFEFANAGPTTLTLNLFFDTYSNANGSNGQPEDVRQKYTQAIWDMMEPDMMLGLMDNAVNALLGGLSVGGSGLTGGAGGLTLSASVDFSISLSPESLMNMLKGRPPIVRFQWGSTSLFSAVITNITEQLTLFLPDGTPVRSKLAVTFQQIKHKLMFPWTNPTSGGSGGERVWRVSKGDTLAWIAYKEYGHPKYWRLIAQANKLTRVRHLEPGTILEIPNA